MDSSILYWLLGALGANCIGFAVVLLWHSNNLMRDKRGFLLWFSLGTLGLVLHLAGVSMMIETGQQLGL